MLFVARLNPLRLSLSLKGSFVSTSYVAPRRLLYQRPGSFDQKSRNGEHLGWPQPTPYEISQRLIAAASRGELNKAIEIVKRSAVDSQSTSVWNTLLKQVLVAERYKLSYDVFTDMKRRGFKPNLRTYHTMLSGYAKAPVTILTQGAMERAQKIYEQYRIYCEQLPPDSTQRSPTPTNDYLRILAKNGRYEAMFEVFWEMPPTGPLAPDLVTFTELLNAIRYRKTLPGVPGNASTASEADIALRNADDVNFMWKRLVGASERQGFKIDAYAVAPTIFALARGSVAAQEQAFSIVHDHLGFSPDAGTIPKPRKISLSSQLLTSVLELCIITKNYERCAHYTTSVMRHKSESEPGVLQRGHMMSVLQSLAALSSPQSSGVPGRAFAVVQWMLQEEAKGGWRRDLRPDINAYFQAFLACRRSKDWVTACKLFELMSGYRISDFERPSPESRGCSAPSNHELPARFAILPDPAIMNLMGRTATLSSSSRFEGSTPKPVTRIISDSGPIYTSLRIITHFGTDYLFGSLPASRAAQAMDASRNHRERLMNQRRLAATILDLHECLTSSGAGGAKLGERGADPSGASSPVLPPTLEELQRWKVVKAAALQFVKSTVRREKQASGIDVRVQE